MTKETVAEKKIASHIRVAGDALAHMKAAAKANDLETAAAAAKKLLAANDAANEAAKAAGLDLTDEQLKALGYVEDEGGTWGLDLPMPIIDFLAAEKRRNG